MPFEGVQGHGPRSSEESAFSRDHLREFDRTASRVHRRDTYLKIKVKIKHLQKLKLNIFPVKIKHSLDKKFSKFDKTLKNFL